MSNTLRLLEPIQLGAWSLPNRMIMAPLTRCRAGAGNVAGPLNALYYEQRSTAGLIISEATQVAPGGQGYPGTPGIHSAEQVEGWKLVTDAVHKAGGRIVLQLWHVGRVSHSSYQTDGGPPYSSSAVAATGIQVATLSGMKTPEIPRAMTVDEIHDVIAQFRQGAINAKAAGFDGVEIHGANGYLLEQFLRDGINHRTDEWGGSIANRSRFHLAITKEVVEVWGADRVGIRLSPSGTFCDSHDSDHFATYHYLVKQLDAFKLAYLHVTRPSESDLRHGSPNIPLKSFREVYHGKVIGCGEFSLTTGETAIEDGSVDSVAFGRLFIANPDLVERAREGASLNPPDEPSFYAGGEHGYTDYPFLPRK